MSTADADTDARDGILASLTAHLDLLGGRIDQWQEQQGKPTIPRGVIEDVTIMGALTASGTLDHPGDYGPRDGYNWDLRVIRLWGFTAGNVAVYRNDANGTELGNATAPGTITFSGNTFLHARDRLVFVASGITGNVVMETTAIQVADAWWPVYLA